VSLLEVTNLTARHGALTAVRDLLTDGGATFLTWYDAASKGVKLAWTGNPDAFTASRHRASRSRPASRPTARTASVKAEVSRGASRSLSVGVWVDSTDDELDDSEHLFDSGHT